MLASLTNNTLDMFLVSNVRDCFLVITEVLYGVYLGLCQLLGLFV